MARVTQRERARCAVAARGSDHIECAHDAGYFDGRLDAEIAIRALSVTE